MLQLQLIWSQSSNTDVRPLSKGAIWSSPPFVSQALLCLVEASLVSPNRICGCGHVIHFRGSFSFFTSWHFSYKCLLFAYRCTVNIKPSPSPAFIRFSLIEKKPLILPAGYPGEGSEEALRAHGGAARYREVIKRGQMNTGAASASIPLSFSLHGLCHHYAVILFSIYLFEGSTWPSEFKNDKSKSVIREQTGNCYSLW